MIILANGRQGRQGQDDGGCGRLFASLTWSQCFAVLRRQGLRILKGGCGRDVALPRPE